MSLSRSLSRGFASLSLSSSKSSWLSPAVMFLVRSENIDPASIKGSGKDGRLLKYDVILAMKNGTAKKLAQSSASSAAPAVSVFRSGRSRTHTDLPFTAHSSSLSSRALASSRSVPHSFIFQQREEVNIDNFLALQKSLDKIPSINAFILRAVSLALRAVPQVNARFNGQEYEAVKSIDVNYQSAAGFQTRIALADRKRIQDLDTIIAKPAADASADSSAASFTVCSLAATSIRSWSSIVNPPQAATLTVSGTYQVSIPTDNTPSTTDLSAAAAVPAAVLSPRVEISLAYDERAFEPETANAFLKRVKDAIETPERLFL